MKKGVKIKKSMSTKKKLIISLIITLLWYFALFILGTSMRCMCVGGAFENCIDYEFLTPLKSGCHCNCTSIYSFVLEYIIVILPFFISYILLSKNKKRVLKKSLYLIAIVILFLLIIAGFYTIFYKQVEQSKIENTNVEDLKEYCLSTLRNNEEVNEIKNVQVFNDSDSYEVFLENYEFHYDSGRVYQKFPIVIAEIKANYSGEIQQCLWICGRERHPFITPFL
ncbi:MAG: hypothetical protein PVJ67_05870 [Candidatus Pacearchaeota archaeon]|jgi:hypothetical protein